MKHFLRFLPILLAALLVCALAFGLDLVATHVSPLAAGLLGLALLMTPLTFRTPSYRLGAAATAPVNTQRRQGEIIYLPMAATAKIYQGTLAAKDANGRAVRASDTAGLRVTGRAEETVDNTSGAAGDLSINIYLGVFKFANSATNALTQADIGKNAVVEDDNTVASTSTNKVNAGRVVAVDSDGVWVDTRYAYFGAKSVPAIASVQEATANGSDAATTQALANSLKAKYNTLQADVAALFTAFFG